MPRLQTVSIHEFCSYASTREQLRKIANSYSPWPELIQSQNNSANRLESRLFARPEADSLNDNYSRWFLDRQADGSFM